MDNECIDVTTARYRLAEQRFIQHALPNAIACHGSYSARIAETESEILEAETILQSLQREPYSPSVLQQMGNQQTTIKRLQNKRTQLMCTRRCIAVTADDLEKQLRAIVSIPRMRKLWVAEGRLVYRTYPLYGKDHDNEWRRIGPFEISFDLVKPTRESFRWRNLDGAKGQWHAPPNIYAVSGSLFGIVSCAGNAQPTIDVAGDTCDYLSLVAFSIRYPECAGAEKTSVINQWKRVPVEQVPPWYIDTFGS